MSISMRSVVDASTGEMSDQSIVINVQVRSSFYDGAIVPYVALFS
jgi:hypothetical protein